MPTGLIYLLFISSFVIGVGLGGAIVFFFRRMAVNRLLRVAQRRASRIELEAKENAKNTNEQARVEAEKIRAAADNEYRERRLEVQRQENRLLSKTENLERKLEGVAQRERPLQNKEKSLDTLRAQIEEAKNKQVKQLEIISSMSTNDAKEVLLQRMESEIKEEASRRMREWEEKLKEEADI